jgi:hypothetical protein
VLRLDVLKRIHVGGLPLTIESDDLKRRFSPFGDVRAVQIIHTDEGKCSCAISEATRGAAASPFCERTCVCVFLKKSFLSLVSCGVLFGQHVLFLNLPYPFPFQGHCRGFAYVDLYTSPLQWRRCLTTYQKTKWHGKELTMQDARPNYIQRMLANSEALSVKKVPQKKAQKVAIHSRCMDVVTIDTIGSHSGWRKTRQKHLLHVMRIRKGRRIFPFDTSKCKTHIHKRFADNSFPLVQPYPLEKQAWYMREPVCHTSRDIQCVPSIVHEQASSPSSSDDEKAAERRVYNNMNVHQQAEADKKTAQSVLAKMLGTGREWEQATTHVTIPTIVRRTLLKEDGDGLILNLYQSDDDEGYDEFDVSQLIFNASRPKHTMERDQSDQRKVSNSNRQGAIVEAGDRKTESQNRRQDGQRRSQQTEKREHVDNMTMDKDMPVERHHSHDDGDKSESESEEEGLSKESDREASEEETSESESDSNETSDSSHHEEENDVSDNAYTAGPKTSGFLSSLFADTVKSGKCFFG